MFFLNMSLTQISSPSFLSSEKEDSYIHLEALFLNHLIDLFQVYLKQYLGVQFSEPSRDDLADFLIQHFLAKTYSQWFQMRLKEFPDPESVFDFFSKNPRIVFEQIALEQVQLPHEFWTRIIETYCRLRVPSYNPQSLAPDSDFEDALDGASNVIRINRSAVRRFVEENLRDAA